MTSSVDRPEAGFTVWFTGLSGSGKSTIAGHLASTLRARGLPVVVIDGDEVRAGLSADLTFSRADRDTQVRRVGWICRLLTASGVVAIAALVSPYEATRAEVKAVIGRCLMVSVEAQLETLAARDTKGLYRAAASGAVTDLTGVGDPYESPPSPDVRCQSDGDESAEACAARIVERLLAVGYLV
ncbi:MAG TPA: adenylyl-sulfate kinase [Candidatus Limnocylindrales bacterium]|jgi:adenylyl-sulfate kinase